MLKDNSKTAVHISKVHLYSSVILTRIIILIICTTFIHLTLHLSMRFLAMCHVFFISAAKQLRPAWIPSWFILVSTGKAGLNAVNMIFLVALCWSKLVWLTGK